ncbi:transcription factor SOX-3-like isoform X2 [Maniola jurtina]|uniref:transcription factor SOX-3-like isoform X2 n=1 Tax=Maniola jurtina TaxID=191418 RepID=UPI001E68D292|nr:transcription factor SOX-3-like isoform X2 [Maniola jurtina]
MMKTAVTVLQEMMVKMNQVPEYECISQSGPQHQATFEYRCVAQGVAVTGVARSKKEAKQEAARRMLLTLHARGLPVPPPYAAALSPEPPEPSDNPALEAGGGGGGGGGAGAGALDTRSYVAVLRELCEEYRLGEATYELVGDTGPPHLRHFTVRAALGLHSRTATATTKKQARQLAAEHLYTYLRENLARLTKDFVEEEALQRAQEKSASRARTDAALARLEAAHCGADAAPARPDLGQRVAMYHHGEDTCRRGLDALAPDAAPEEPEAVLQRVCDELGLRVERLSLGPKVSVVRLAPTDPSLTFGGLTPRAAAAAALRYVRRMLPAQPDAAAAH